MAAVRKGLVPFPSFPVKCSKATHKRSRFLSRVGRAAFAIPVEFDDVQPTLSLFDSGDEGSLPSKFSGKLALSKASRLSKGYKFATECGVLRAESAFFHAPMMHGRLGCSQNASMLGLVPGYYWSGGLDLDGND